MSAQLSLAHGITFADLYSVEGAARIDARFVEHLQASDAPLAARLAAARAQPSSLDRKAESDLLIAVAPHVEDFLASLFGIADEVRALEARHHELAPIFVVKRQFVQRKAMNAHKADEAATFDGPALRSALEGAMGAPFSELGFAQAVTRWLADEAAHAAQLDIALRYAAWASHTPAGKTAHRGGVLFRAPRKLDYMKLVPVQTETARGFTEHTLEHLRTRDGFKLTDPGTDLTGALDETNYCIWCHEQGKDSCSKGLKEKAPAEGFKKTVFGVPLAGCPLEEKISEFQMVKSRGEPLAALGIIAVDNPMAAATGHRI